MPIVSPNDEAPPRPKPTIQQIAAPSYKGVTVDTSVEPVSQLLTHVEGSSWIVQYYSQVLDTDSATSGQSLGTSPVHLQYRVIKGMELKVTAPLTTSQNDQTKALSHVGGATVYPFVIPNEGDVFLADMGSGQEAIFEVTNVQRMSVFRQAVHAIEYKMTNYSTALLRADLDNKTVQAFFYEKDFLMHGQNPLLFEEEYVTVQWLRENYRSITKSWFKSFFSREYSTILVPGQEQPTYDPYLVKAVLRFFTVNDAQEVRLVRPMNLEDDYASRAIQFWDVLADGNIKLLRDSFTKVGTVSTAEYSSDGMMEGIRFSGIANVIYPTDPLLTVDYNQVPPPKLVSGVPLNRGPVRMITPSDVLAGVPMRDVFPRTTDAFNTTDVNGTVITNPQVPLTHPAMKDGFYVLSRAFYEATTTSNAGVSKLELAVLDYLNKKPLTYPLLKALCEDMDEWNAIDRFYYTPIVLMLIMATLRRVT